MITRLRQVKKYFMELASLLRQATSHGTRSTVLRPLGWLIGILSALLTAAIRFEAPTWMGASIVVFLGLSVCLYLGAYTYCLVKDREALRSEKYTIQKLAIEKGFIGDSITGVFPIEPATGARLIGPTATSTSKEDRQ